MANRSVVVELKLQSDQYKTEIEAAKLKTEELDRKVEALDHDVNDLGRDSVKASAEVGVLGESAKKTGTDVEDLGTKTEDTTGKTVRARDEFGRFKKSTDDAGSGVEDLGEKTEDLGKKVNDGGASISTLRTRIDELEKSLKSTGAAFAANASPDLLKRFRSDSSELSGLKSTVSEMEKLGVEVEGLGLKASKAGPALGALFSGGLMSPAGIAAISALVVPALAMIGGLTGVLAGAGVAAGGIAGAIAGNPAAFKTAWGDAIGTVKKDWIDASVPFTGPTMDAIRSIGPLVDSWHIDTMFAKAATFVGPLVAGAEGFATGIVHGVEDLVNNAGPEIKVFAADLPQIGSAIGNALSMISDNATGGAEAIHALDQSLEVLAATTGGLVSGSEAFVSAIDDAGNATRNWLDNIPGWVQDALPPLWIWQKMFDTFMPDSLGKTDGMTTKLTMTTLGLKHAAEEAGDAFTTQGDDLTALGQNLSATKLDADSLAEAMSIKVLDTTMSLDQATLHFDESLTQVGETLKKNRNALNEHSAKGQEDVSVILAGVSANIAVYKANVQAGIGAEAAASAYDAGTAALERQLRQSGLTQASIDQLIGKYRGVPKKVDTDIAINGLTDAINSLGDLIAQINHIDGHNYHSTVTVDYIANRQSLTGNQVPSYSNNAPTAPHGATPHASGGFLDSGWNLVGEEGPELVRGQQIYTAAQTRSMMASNAPSWGGGSNSTAVQVSLTAAPGGNLTALGTLINGMIRDGLIVVKASQVRPA